MDGKINKTQHNLKKVEVTILRTNKLPTEKELSSRIKNVVS